jgi:DNA-binding transcriptional regulator PaaX
MIRKMPKYPGSFISLILDTLNLDVPLVPLESPYEWLNRKKHNSIARKQYQEALWRMRRQGYVKIVEKNNQKFITLTSKGQLERLLEKAIIPSSSEWDGKWRVLMFDIPENSRFKRDHFRFLLRKNNFIKLQGSVFISPYPLGRAAVEYLHESGLSDFIRILKVEEMDNDSDMRKRFHLHNSRP